MQVSQEIVPRKAPDAIDVEAFWAAIEQKRLALWIVAAKTLEPTQILRTDTGRMFHFDGPEPPCAVYNEVDFHAGCSAPEEHLIGLWSIGNPRPQMLGYQAFKGTSIDFFGPIQGPAWP